MDKVMNKPGMEPLLFLVFMVLERMRPMALILDTRNLSVTDVLNDSLVNNRISKISHVKVSPLIILYLV